MMNNKKLIQDFYEKIRSGNELASVSNYMHKKVIAHQVLAEAEPEVVISRTPKEYADHVSEMRDTYGKFKLSIEEILSENNKVYVRWRQIGMVNNIPITEIGSAVYLIKDTKISEYWIQIDRKGIEEQLNK